MMTLLLLAGCAGPTGPSGETTTTADTSGVTTTPYTTPPPTTGETAATGSTADTGVVQTGPVTDAFPIALPSEVDVLMVIDNSGSMAIHQNALATNLPSLFQYVLGSPVDYHLGVVTTDMEDPAQSGALALSGGLRWVDANTPNPSEVYANMVRRGTAGSGTEQGLAAVYAALGPNPPSENAGFRRDTADLHVVVVSDEHDASVTDNLPKQGFDVWYASVPNASIHRTFSSVTSPAGTEYEVLATQFGGVREDLLTADWSAALDALGIAILHLPQRFALSATPDESSIVVTVVRGKNRLLLDEAVFSGSPPVPVSGTWAYDAVDNAVWFPELVPDPGDIVEIVYDRAP